MTAISNNFNFRETYSEIQSFRANQREIVYLTDAIEDPKFYLMHRLKQVALTIATLVIGLTLFIPYTHYVTLPALTKLLGAKISFEAFWGVTGLLSVLIGPPLVIAYAIKEIGKKIFRTRASDIQIKEKKQVELELTEQKYRAMLPQIERQIERLQAENRHSKGSILSSKVEKKLSYLKELSAIIKRQFYLSDEVKILLDRI